MNAMTMKSTIDHAIKTKITVTIVIPVAGNVVTSEGANGSKNRTFKLPLKMLQSTKNTYMTAPAIEENANLATTIDDFLIMIRHQ